MANYINSGATISTCGKYRYRLWREWRGGHRWRNGKPLSCVFVMLNPSTADGETDDPTIRRCVAFAKAWGYDRLDVVNLFAIRATDPKALLALNHGDEPWGVANQEHIQRAIQDAGIIVCAWGAHGGHLDQDETVMGWMASHDHLLHALTVTKDGFPGHPLYLPATSQPIRYRGRKYRSAA